MTYKNIRIKMKGGKSRTQRVKVLKSGKYKFVKNLGSRVKKYTKRRRKSNPKRRTRKVARRKKRGARKFTLPLAVVGGLIGGIGRTSPRGTTLIGDVIQGDFEGLMYDAREILGGVDMYGRLQVKWLVETYGPIVAGLLIHKFIGGPPLNLNRALAAANVPFIRI